MIGKGGKYAALGIIGAVKRNKSIVVIGEGFGRALKKGELDRVVKKALEVGAEYYNPRKTVSEIGFKKAMRNNYQWFRRKYLQGYKKIDIGEYSPRKIRGVFYEAERRWSALWRWE